MIHVFLEFCALNKENLNEMESSLADFMMLRGTVYRYFGIADSRYYRKKQKVNPEYNNTYVSWIRSERNAYIESKQYGSKTWMKAELMEAEFGIDIHGFELWCEKWLGGSSFITRGEKKEVVFSTLENNICEIIYW